MPKFILKLKVTNNSGVSVSAHVGASLVGVNNHSSSTKISDLLLLMFSVAYFIAGLCFAKDLFACFVFLFCVIIIILIKYLKLSDENEEQ